MHGGRGGSSCGGGYGGCYGGGSSCGGGYGGCSGGGWSCGGGYGGGCSGGGYGGWSCGGGMGGGWSCGGASAGCYGGVVAPAMTAPVEGGQGEQLQKMPKGGSSMAMPQPATIIVSLPADATLLVDDSPTTSTSSRRVFVSPSLSPGKTYHYTLRAEAQRDGKPVRVEERVAVRAGEESKVKLTLPPSEVARR